MLQPTRLLATVLTSIVFVGSNHFAFAEGGAAKPTVKRASSESWPSFGHAFGWRRRVEIATRPNLHPEWTTKVGQGRGQVVGDSEMIYVAAGSSVKENDEHRVETVLTAYTSANGKPKWTYRERGQAGDKQQTFGGGRAGPQATPLILGDRIVMASFIGDVICLNKTTGERLWRLSTTQAFSAEPVQFGFSSSPIACPDDESSFVLLAGGGQGGLMKFSVASSEPQWVRPIDGFSYATPVLATLAGVPQWIVHAQDAVLGIRDSDGKLLWRSELKEAGLTNVPTPLVVDSTRILVSGQGCGGLQCLRVTNEQGNWSVEEAWFHRTQFFYTNWIMLNDRVALGCTDRYLTAFDCGSGERLGRWRGFGDGNVVHASDCILLLNGTGTLSVLASSETELRVLHRYAISQGRFWTTPSLIGNRLYARSGDQLECFSFREDAAAGDRPDQITSKRKQTRLTLSESAPTDPVIEIFERFESKGQESALALYDQLRRQGKLKVDQRLQLAEAADAEGLADLATLVLQHAAADFPESERIKSKLKRRHDR